MGSSYFIMYNDPTQKRNNNILKIFLLEVMAPLVLSNIFLFGLHDGLVGLPFTKLILTPVISFCVVKYLLSNQIYYDFLKLYPHFWYYQVVLLPNTKSLRKSRKYVIEGKDGNGGIVLRNVKTNKTVNGYTLENVRVVGHEWATSQWFIVICTLELILLTFLHS